MYVVGCREGVSRKDVHVCSESVTSVGSVRVGGVHVVR